MSGIFYPRHENAVLFITHIWDDACAAQVNKLQAQLGGHYDIIVLGYIPNDRAKPEVPDDVTAIFYGDEDFAIRSEFLVAKERFHQMSALRFFHDYPGYGHYWMIEFDVRYGGSWADLFAELNDPAVDLYASVVQRKQENPEWFFWQSFSTAGDNIPDDARVKMFTPFIRVSNAAFRAIWAAYKLGWTGHFEALWPTAAVYAGLKIEDIGGAGSFTPESRRGRHYTTNALDPYLSPGSFVFRPSILEHEVPADTALLWHPVKPASLGMPIPPPPEPTWRDFPPLQPARLSWRRLRAAFTPRQAAKTQL